LRVLVTRGEGQARDVADLLHGRGGVPVLFPTVEIVPAEDPAPLDAAIASLPAFDWLLFSSANGVRHFALRARRAIDAGLPPRLRIGSVGPGTTRAASDEGMTVFLEAGTHTAEGLVEALSHEGVDGKRILVPRAAEGREALVEGLSALGAVVSAPVAYRTGPAEKDEAVAAAILADPPDVCTFASPSAFRNFFDLMGDDAARSVLSRSLIAVIGEVTARAVENRRMRVDIMPSRYTIPGMLDAIEDHFRTREGAAR
jgi:uroporphyrinogen III methyltransferase/synthase